MNKIENLKETTTLNKDWINSTNAVPTEIAIIEIKGQLKVAAIYWEGDDGGAWDDENIVSVAMYTLKLEK